MRATASTVAPPGPKPVEVLTKRAPASTARRQASSISAGVEERDLEDDLDQAALGGGDDPLQVAADRGVVAVLEAAEVDHDVELVGAVGHRLRGLGDLDGRAAGAEREADHRADGDLSLQTGARQRHPRGVHAHAGEAVLAGLGAQGLDLGAGRRRAQQRVVDDRGELGLGQHDGARTKGLVGLVSTRAAGSSAAGVTSSPSPAGATPEATMAMRGGRSMAADDNSGGGGRQRPGRG
jgi:hypothetical protein